MPALYTPEFIAKKLPHLTTRGQGAVYKKIKPIEAFRGTLLDVKKLGTLGNVKTVDGKIMNIKIPIKELLPRMNQAVLIIYASNYNIRKLSGKLSEVSDLIGGTSSTNPVKVLAENMNYDTLRGTPAKTVFFHPSELKKIYTKDVIKALLQEGVKPSVIKEMTKAPEYVNTVIKEFLTDAHQRNVDEIINQLDQYKGSTIASNKARVVQVKFRKGKVRPPLHRIIKEFLPWFPKAIVRINRQIRPDIEMHSEVNDKLKDAQARGAKVTGLVNEINQGEFSSSMGANVVFHLSQVKDFYSKKLLKKLFRLGVTKQGLYHMVKDRGYVDNVFKEYWDEFIKKKGKN